MDKIKIEGLVRELLIALGENPDREGIKDTPHRVSEMCEELLSEHDYKCVTFEESTYNDMIMIKDIQFASFCEHHLLPFFGKISIAYIPSSEIIGLSKIARIIDKYTHRLQLQERLTCQIRDEIYEKLNPKGIGVYIEAEHTCMTVRGVKARGSRTITTSFCGVMEDTNLQSIFINLVKG